MQLSGHAKETVRAATHPVNIWDGCVGSSKTQTSTLAWIRHLVTEAPPGPIAIVGSSQKSIHRNVVPALQSWLGNDAMAVKQDSIQMLGRTAFLFGGSNESHQGAIAGASFASAYVDEASLLVESAWDMLQTRLRIPGKPRLFATTNPASPRHWLFQRWVSKAALHLRHGLATASASGQCHRFTMGPSDNLGMGPEYWQRMERSFSGAFYRRYILGEWVSAEGVIYPLSSRQVVDLPDAPIDSYFVGLDYGTTNPTAAVLIGEGRDHRAYQLEEMYLDSAVTGEQTTAQHLVAFDAWMRSVDRHWPGARFARRIYADPAAASFRTTLRHAGWPVAAGNNEVLSGIRLTASMMSTDRLRILRRCERTLDEDDGYAWDPAQQEKGQDAPLKVDDHLVDSRRYCIMGRRQLYQSWVDNAGLGSSRAVSAR